jgi:hypothetical protein
LQCDGESKVMRNHEPSGQDVDAVAMNSIQSRLLVIQVNNSKKTRGFAAGIFHNYDGLHHHLWSGGFWYLAMKDARAVLLIIAVSGDGMIDVDRPCALPQRESAVF